jgi:ribonuclease BN (tRNA processing enzyme)
MKLTIVGSGDAFGSGGRLQTCFHVAADDYEFLIDCGATALIGMARLGLDAGRVQAVYITHLHGDHFAGLVWLLMHAQYVVRRTAPLTIIGPRGLADRLKQAGEALFPGFSRKERGFVIEIYEHVAAMPLDVGPVTSEAFEVNHPSGAPAYALRLTHGGKTIGFSGDTEWVDALRDVAAHADIYITECFGFDTETPYHMTWQTISKKLPELGAKRIVLSHMGEHMLAHRTTVDHPRVTVLEDGMRFDV